MSGRISFLRILDPEPEVIFASEIFISEDLKSFEVACHKITRSWSSYPYLEVRLPSLIGWKIQVFQVEPLITEQEAGTNLLTCRVQISKILTRQDFMLRNLFEPSQFVSHRIATFRKLLAYEPTFTTFSVIFSQHFCR